MQFHEQCSLDNPLEGFTKVSAANGSLSNESRRTLLKPHVSITCLLTGGPSSGVHRHPQPVHRGLDFVTVCVTLSAALIHGTSSRASSALD